VKFFQNQNLNKKRTFSKMDESLYSRQLMVLGLKAQERLQSSKILVTGKLGGLAAEICKNLVLAGVHSLTLCDDKPCSVGDLASHFFMSEEDVTTGVKRSLVLEREVKELNGYVRVSSCPEIDLTFDETGLGAFDVVVLVNSTKAFMSKVGSFCHDSIGVVYAGTYGLYGYVFCDFGSDFCVVDKDGEQARHGVIVEIKQSEEDPLVWIVYTSDERRHELIDGDIVRLSGVQGLVELNTERPIRNVNIVNAEGKLVCGYAFSITLDSILDKKYLGGGHFEQLKSPVKIDFLPFEASLDEPQIIQNDWSSPERHSELHGYLLAIWEYEESHDGRLPSPGSELEACALLEIAKSNSTVSDESLFLDLGKGAAGQLSPMAAFIGGIAAQEVLKACSGKFTPIVQWLHFASPECLAKETAALTFPSIEQLDGSIIDGPLCRYSGQAAVFGWEFQTKLSLKRCFMVGAGALGCENLKNFALMGVSSGSSLFLVSDMDGIENSNLNRQFLFRPRHIGQMKSVVAAAMVRTMNPAFNVKAMELKVAPETEGTFDDSFWSSLDVVINALDNIPARLYVDSKCVFFGKPLLESGTLGTKANTLPVIPYMTESYGSDPVNDDRSLEIPACTLHAYPNLIEHTIAWARDAVFEKYCKIDPMEGELLLKHWKTTGSLDNYIADLDAQPSTKLSRIRTARGIVKGILPSDHPEKLFPYLVNTTQMNVESCVLLARLRFEELFVNKILLLLHVHPPDKKLDDNGTLFWSGKRRPPVLQLFNAMNPTHYLFVDSMVRVLAKIYNVPLPREDLARETVIRESLSQLPAIPDFVCDESVVIPANDAEAKELKNSQDQEIENNFDLFETSCKSEICGLEHLNGDMVVVSQEFEKDDDSNGHMDLIFAASSIRASEYSIPLIDRLQTKMIVGRIIPAIATTTAMTTGAIALEFYKLMHSHPLEMYRCANINLAVNSYASFEPTPCTISKFGLPQNILAGEKCMDVSLWSMVTLEGNMRIQDVVDYFQDHFEFEVMSVSTNGGVVLYNDLFGQEERLHQSVSSLYKSVSGEDPPKYILLTVDGEFEDDEEEIVVPACRILWKP